MFACHDVRAESWQPDFSSSSQPNPTWTRLRLDGKVIANSVTGLDWDDNPRQAVVCDHCGTIQCESGGWVHISRLGEFVLWTLPQIPEEDTLVGLTPLRTYGALAFPKLLWNSWNVPRADFYPLANERAIVDAWVLGPGREPETIVDVMHERMIGCDTLSKDEAIAIVERTLQNRGAIEKEIVLLEDVGARLETIYFEGPDWPAFAFAGHSTFVALDRRHLLRVR